MQWAREALEAEQEQLRAQDGWERRRDSRAEAFRKLHSCIEWVLYTYISGLLDARMDYISGLLAPPTGEI